MAVTQADLDAALKALSDDLDKLANIIAPVEPPTVDLTEEVAAVNALQTKAAALLAKVSPAADNTVNS